MFNPFKKKKEKSEKATGFNLGMEKVKEDPRIIFVREIAVAVLLFNVLRHIVIASQTHVMENVLLAMAWFIFAWGMFLHKPWAKPIVMNIYRVLFVIGLFSLVLNAIGKDVGYFFSLFYYAEELKLNEAVIRKGILVFMIECFGMVLMLDDRESVLKAIFAGILVQIIAPILFFVYLGSLYSGDYVDLYSKYVRFDQLKILVNENKSTYYFSEPFEYKMESENEWAFLFKEEMLDLFGIKLDPGTELSLIKIEQNKVLTIDVKAFKSFNPADAYAELEGFRFAMLAQDKKILKDERIPAESYEIYNIVTFSSEHHEGRAIYRIISNRLVIDFFISAPNQEKLFQMNDEILPIVKSVKIY